MIKTAIGWLRSIDDKVSCICENVSVKQEDSVAEENNQNLANLINVKTNLTKERIRTSGSNTYVAPYRSISITALSDDVVIDGQAVPQGFSEAITSNENEEYIQNTAVAGSDYFITITRNA